MRAALAPVAALLCCTFLMLVGSGLAGTLIPVRADAETFSAVAIGLIGTFNYIGFVIGCFLCPYAVRRGGHIRAFSAFSAGAAAAVLIHPIVVEPVTWCVLRGIAGFCFAGLFMVIESWLNERARNETRGQVFSIYQVVLLVGATGGQQLLGLAPVTGFELFTVAAVLIALAVVPVSMTASPPPAPVHRVRVRVGWLFRVSPVAVIGCGLGGAANGAVWAFAPVFAQFRGLGGLEVGWFMSALIIGGAVTQWPVGRLSDRLDRRAVLAVIAAGSAAAGIVLATAGSAPQALLLLQVAVFGGFALTIYSLSIAHVNDLVAPEQFVDVSSAMLLVWGLGAIAGPLAASALMEATSYAGLFLFTAANHMLIAAVAAARLVLRPRRRAPEPEPFVVAMPRPAPVVSELDPRAGESPAGMPGVEAGLDLAPGPGGTASEPSP